MNDQNTQATDDSAGFTHGLDEENSLQADVPRPDDSVAEEDKQVNDPDVDTSPAQPVPHTSNDVVGRRNPDLPTENLSTPPTSSTDTSAGAGA